MAEYDSMCCLFVTIIDNTTSLEEIDDEKGTVNPYQ